MAATAVLAGCSASASKNPESSDISGLLEKGIKPNEMGMVMILEYHRIADKESDYTRSVENFKKDLETLYEKGYRLVKFSDLMNGNINVPAGTTPVAFTFDDSVASQFSYVKENGKLKIDEKCAVGMMEEFGRKHPDFGCTALFNYLPTMFEQPKYVEKKVDYLYRNGYEFGDHTVEHLLLRRQTDEVVQREIAVPIKNMKEINPKVKVETLCLPCGSIPENEELMYKGSYDGTSYNLKWALLVGSNPMYTQYHYKNPGRLIPRIQVMDYDPEDGSGAEGSEYWLNYFDKHPELRFISDGSSSTICAPAYMKHRLLPERLPAGVSFVGY
ncbi:MAG: polysaccharide deacetylase [Actinobacteria bacterium]|nr:polysaccharide deacetylase [Actinomycetota bacterium]